MFGSIRHLPLSTRNRCFGSGVGSDENGMMFVEFALIASFLIVALMGAFDFGRLGMRYSEAQSVAKAGVQFVLQNQANISDADAIKAAALADASSPTLTVAVDSFCQCAGSVPQACNVSCADGKYAPRYVSVVATDTLELMFPYPGLEQSRTVVASSSGRVR